jgi:mercuric ion transport protein
MKEKLLAAGGMAGALGASACCIAPLALVSIGVSGAWIGGLTGLAPYQPYFLALAAASLGAGFWLVYGRRGEACADDAACARPLPNRLVKSTLWVALVLVAVALGVNFGAPLLI